MIKVTCRVKNETLEVSADLLFKEGIIKPEVEFPDYITVEDVQVYSQFQSTGYIQPSSLSLATQLVLVADYLSQSSLCLTLIEEVIFPLLNPSNFPKILQRLKFISNQNLSKFFQILEKFINFDLQDYQNFVQFFPLNMLKQEILKSPENESFLGLYLQKSNEKTFLEIIESELQTLESLTFASDLEVVFKTDLKNLNKQSQAHNFSFKELEMKLLIEYCDSFEEGVELVLFSDCEAGPVIQGKVVFQGESRGFCYVRGTRLTICRTSLKTRTSSLKLSLKNQQFLTVLLPKAADEALEGNSLSGLSPCTISLVSSYLKNKVDGEKIIEVIADWRESNPRQSVLEVFKSTDWTSEDEEFWARISKNYPFLSKDHQIFPLLTTFKSQAVGSPVQKEENLCESPTETPFNLDLSEINSPKSLTDKLKINKPLCSRSFQMSASEFESTLKYSQIQNKFFSPNKQKTGRLASLEEILKLKKKLLNYRAHHKSLSFSSFQF